MPEVQNNGNQKDAALPRASPGRNTNTHLLLLSLGHIVFSTAFGLLQERAFLVPGFKYGGFMTVVTCATYIACALVEIMFDPNTHFAGGVKNYLILALSTFCGMYFTNWSLQYLSFPIRIIFKSSKLIPVMLVSILLGKKMSKSLFARNCALVLGLVLFLLGDSKSSSKSTSLFGLLLICLGVLSDAFTCNFEEHVFLKKLKVSRSVIILFTNVFSLLYSAALCFVTGELVPALSHAREHPEVVALIAAFSVVNYFSVSFVLAIIQHFGSTESELAKTIRKFLSVIMSFVVFPKPVNYFHVLGGLLFFASTSTGMLSKSKRH